ncbi:MAG TPA: NUDIX hydrolase [Polyangiaceae bacterium]|nr:NUDIX hydrolase [Polyangiaceae bacterium]
MAFAPAAALPVEGLAAVRPGLAGALGLGAAGAEFTAGGFDAGGFGAAAASPDAVDTRASQGKQRSILSPLARDRSRWRGRRRHPDVLWLAYARKPLSHTEFTMPSSPSLPELPLIRLELVEDQSPPHQTGFLRLVRRRFRAIYPDGSRSAEFTYDEVDRPAIDAVVIVAYYLDAHGERRVFLRSSLRPPIVLRDRTRSPRPGADPVSSIWELAAGLVEQDEQTESGLKTSAIRELEEELGFRASPDQVFELGPSTFPAGGVIAERHFYFGVRVDPKSRQDPGLDGSALEHGGVVTDVTLTEALAMCRDGRIVDAKTELGLRRLAETPVERPT